MAKLPSFQFYPGDWKKDANLARATLEARGALIEILIIAFECEKRGVLQTGKIPWTIREIAQAIPGETNKNEKAVCELLALKVLKKNRNNAIFSQRMCKDEKFRQKRIEGGKLGGIHGVKGKEFGVLGGRPTKIPPIKPPSEPPPSSSSSSSSSNSLDNLSYKKIKKESKEKKENESLPEIKMPWGSENFSQQWEHWKHYKATEHKFNYKSKESEQASLNELEKISNGIEKEAIEIIMQSMSNGWKGFFEIKNRSNGTKKLNKSEQRLEDYKQFINRRKTNF